MVRAEQSPFCLCGVFLIQLQRADLGKHHISAGRIGAVLLLTPISQRGVLTCNPCEESGRHAGPGPSL